MNRFHRQKTAKQLQETIDNWNNAVSPGTEVTYRNDKGEFIRTKTRTRAEILSGHSAVVWLDDVRGCVDLSCVSVVPLATVT